MLVRKGWLLKLRVRSEWRDVDEPTRLAFLHRITAAGTKATNRETGVDYLTIESERRGGIPMNTTRETRAVRANDSRGSATPPDAAAPRETVPRAADARPRHRLPSL